MRNIIGSTFRGLPPVRRRDERITELRNRIRQLDRLNSDAESKAIDANRASTLSSLRAAEAVSQATTTLLQVVEAAKQASEAAKQASEAAASAVAASQRVVDPHKDGSTGSGVSSDLAGAKKQLAETKTQLAETKKRLEAPSFVREVMRDRRITTNSNRIGSSSHRHDIAGKRLAQRIAQGCGARVPEIYATWSDHDSIDVQNLPDEFVIKAEGGAASEGVFPLERTSSGYRIVSTDRVLSPEDIRQEFAALPAKGKVYGKCFAEEYLHGTTADPIPIDIKIYAFYGEVGHVMLRRVGEHGVGSTVVNRYLDTKGNDLGAVSLERPVDSSIPVPQRFAEAIALAKTISIAARLAFIRVDFYETDEGLVFGELTPRPGGSQRYRPEHDRMLGEMWEAAQARLERDLAKGVAFGYSLSGS